MHIEPSAALDRLGRIVVDSAFTVHKEIGPGLLESAYELFLIEELTERGLCVKHQIPIEAQYKTKTVETGFRADLIVDDQILVELKACEKILPVHEAQILTYLKFSRLKLGYLINFNNKLIKDGIRRFVR